MDFGRENSLFPLILIQVKSAAKRTVFGLKDKREKAFLPFKTQLFHIQVVRYAAKENPNLDLEKFTMKEVDIETLRKIFEQQESMKEKESGGNVILAIKNDNNEIIKAYRQQKELLTELSDSLKKVAHYFYCIHIMTRIELCKGK